MFLIPDPGAYAIVLDNRLEGRGAAIVHLQVTLLSGTAQPAPSSSPIRSARGS